MYHPGRILIPKKVAECMTSSRPYRGVPLEERQAERRRKFVEAALSLYSERGYHNTTLRDVCEAAGLTQRYFYESFENAEALLLEAYTTVTFGLIEAITPPSEPRQHDCRERARAMLVAYFTALHADLRCARVFLVEIRGVSQRVDDGVNEAISRIAGITLELMDVPETEFTRMLALGVVGGISQMALQWIKDGCRTDISDMAEVGLALAGELLRFERCAELQT